MSTVTFRFTVPARSVPGAPHHLIVRQPANREHALRRINPAHRHSSHDLVLPVGQINGEERVLISSRTIYHDTSLAHISLPTRRWLCWEMTASDGERLLKDLIFFMGRARTRALQDEGPRLGGDVPDGEYFDAHKMEDMRLICLRHPRGVLHVHGDDSFQFRSNFRIPA